MEVTEGTREKGCPLDLSVVNLVIIARNVIGLQGQEETCFHYLPSCQTGPSNIFRVEEKGKWKAVSAITLGKTKKKEVEVMPISKRTTVERDNRGVPGPSKKKEKAKEGDDATTKKKRRPRRHF